jgi:predicted DNA-binding transcriptional regulator AlpA
MRIVSPAELAPLKGINFSNPYRLELEALGKFPKRVKLGERKYGYIEDELDSWLTARAALRETAAA